ncbi:hypothetical protein TNCV_5101101 [Trichonephila clavipes]|nr:hypothetical protein TNCV_5101101 [Trichonephila clavipes]
MLRLSDFQRCQVVRALLAGESVTETSQLLEVSRGKMSKVITVTNSAAKQAWQSKIVDGKRSSVKEITGIEAGCNV